LLCPSIFFSFRMQVIAMKAVAGHTPTTGRIPSV